MHDQLKLYPSGFLGSNTVAQTKPMDVITAAKQLFNKGLNPQVSRYTANQDVVDLWMDISSGTPEYKKFEFKERVLRAALSAFGTVRIIDWISNQKNSPHFTDNHRRWIDETLSYIFDGKAREMSANNWRCLLTTAHDGNIKEALSPIAKHLLLAEKLKGAPYELPYRGEMTVTEFISFWCKASGGMEDLENSLNVLFGRR